MHILNLAPDCAAASGNEWREYIDSAPLLGVQEQEGSGSVTCAAGGILAKRLLRSELAVLLLGPQMFVERRSCTMPAHKDASVLLGACLGTCRHKLAVVQFLIFSI